MDAPEAAAAPARPSRLQEVQNLLQPIADRLGTPGAAKLAQAARRAGVRVSKEEIKRFLARKGQKQIFRPLPESKGQTASETPSMRYQMDLVDLKFSASRGKRYILVVVNVYTRQMFAEPIKDKTPPTVADGLEKILQGIGSQPVIISSDKGSEFLNEVQDVLDARGIVHRVKSDTRDVNALALVDRSIQSLKKRLAESLAERPGEWADRTAEVVQQYNRTPHETLHDEAPDEAAQGDNKTLDFMLQQDNARKLKHNQRLLEGRVKTLKDEGGFRRPIGGLNKFKRGFKAAYADMEKVGEIAGSKLTPAGGGDPIDVKRVLPVDDATGEVAPGFALGEVRQEEKRLKVSPVLIAIYEFLQDDEKSMSSVAAYLKAGFSDDEYRIYLHSVGAQHLSDVVRLEPGLELTRGGYYVRRT